MNKDNTLKPLVYLAVVLGVASVTMSAFALFGNNRTDKQAYIDLGRVFKEYEYKKEAEKQVIQLQQLKKYELDSLGFVIRSKEERNEADEAARLKQEYDSKLQVFEEEGRSYAAHFDKLIWNKINKQVAAYGLKNRYSFIFGSGGEGSLMYSDEARDITSQVIEHLNKTYRDEK